MMHPPHSQLTGVLAKLAALFGCKNHTRTPSSRLGILHRGDTADILGSRKCVEKTVPTLRHGRFQSLEIISDSESSQGRHS